MPPQDQGTQRVASQPRHDDPLHDLQLRRDLEIINERTAHELGPLPVGGLPVQSKRKPELPKHVRPTPETIAMTMPPEAPTIILSNGLPAPPVPQRLRELLKDYPELIHTLQNDLNAVVLNPSKATPLFESMIWTLEDALGLFITQARGELEAAQADGNAQEIAKADAKLDLMFDARSSNNGMDSFHMDDLWNYCEARKGALR